MWEGFLLFLSIFFKIVKAVPPKMFANFKEGRGTERLSRLVIICTANCQAEEVEPNAD